MLSPSPEAHSPAPPLLADLKRRLAETLARSRLDYTDELMVLGAFLSDFQKGEGVPPSSIRRHWNGLLRGDAAPGHRVDMEIVFPFCAQKCLYCQLGTRVSSGPGLAQYLGDLKQELLYFAPSFSRSELHGLWLGRGTPSLLEEAQLRELMGLVFSSYRFKKDVRLGIECHPASCDAAKIAALRDIGFNQISFGVESLNPRVLRLMRRRTQDYGMIRDAVRWSREAGFDDLNLDLVFGLEGESLESFLDGFRATAELRPTTITVCTLALTQSYMKATGVSRQSYLRDMEGLLPGAMEGLRKLALAAGYDFTELDPRKGVWRFVAHETPKANFRRWSRSDPPQAGASSRLGLGLRSRSHVFSRTLYQRLPRRFSPENPIYRARRLSLREEMAYFILGALNLDSRVDWDAFQKCFGVDLREAFALELGILSAWRKVRLDKDGLVFLPIEPPERIFFGAVFLLDVLARSPHSGGRLDGAFLKRLAKDLS